jgi:hypothetical protein
MRADASHGDIGMVSKPTTRVRSGSPLTVIRFAIAVTCALCVTTSFASDAEDYLRRAAQRDVAMFDGLDRDKNGRLTIEEVRGNIDLEARFNDIDINRDGVITREELTRYIAFRYGVASTPK